MAPNQIHSEDLRHFESKECLQKEDFCVQEEVYYASPKCYKNPRPEPLPKGTKLTDIIKTMPPEVFEKSNLKALQACLVTATATFVALVVIYLSPWYLLPLAWAFAGVAVTGLFVIGHDCAHKSFTKSRLLNDVIGTVSMMPLIYPYESWRIKHNHHHANTNKLDVDNAWQPFRKNWYEEKNPVARLAFRLVKGPMWWFASVGHWVAEHFFLNTFTPEQRPKVSVSIGCVFAFMLAAWPALFYFFGFWGFLNFWVVPWLGYHFWMSTFTMVHHTLPQIPFLPEGIWDDAQARLTFTVHCDYPRWIEFLCHDINVHVPHHVSTAIPSYNLRPAWQALKKHWGQHLHECVFGWELIKDIISTCHIYHENKNYVSFAESTASNPKRKRTGCSMTEGPLLKRLHPIHVPLLVLTPLIALYGLLTFDWNMKTIAWAVLYYYITGLGITAGYHRHFAHRAYDASWPMRWFLMLAGSGAVEGSIRWWARDHRAHHRYTDSDKDPYSALEGFFYSHLGWMLLRQDPKKIGRVDISDLSSDPMIRWQHRNYYWIGPFMGFVFPTLVAGLGWGDWWGGYFVAGVARLVFVHHATFFVNSLAHTLGAATFADKHTPRDSIVTAVLTMGEGYHNFHHEFPNDYRNAIKFWQYDPTKWLIRVCSWFGLTYNLREFPANEIVKGVVQMEQKRIDRVKATLKWARDPATLPAWSWEEVAAQARSRANVEAGIDPSTLRVLVVYQGIVHDVTEFFPDHPGGVKIIEPYIGKDISDAFEGAVYEHSNGAHNLLSTFRVGRIEDEHTKFVKHPNADH